MQGAGLGRAFSPLIALVASTWGALPLAGMGRTFGDQSQDGRAAAMAKRNLFRGGLAHIAGQGTTAGTIPLRIKLVPTRVNRRRFSML